jgi:hypothetical protein
MVRPIRREQLVRFPAEQQIKGLTHLFGHHLAEKLIKVRDVPATVPKAARRVFFWCGWTLHDSVKRAACVRHRRPWLSKPQVIADSANQWVTSGRRRAACECQMSNPWV